MAVAAILAQPSPPAGPEDAATFAAVAAALKQLHVREPLYGRPFCRALDRALLQHAAGRLYEPYNATHYRIQSASRPGQWHAATLQQCGCAQRGPWCWHRALLHLLTATAALQHLDRCPRPSLTQVAPCAGFDIDAVLRACDELI